MAEKCTFCGKVHFWAILAPRGRQKRLRLSLLLAGGATGAHFSKKCAFSQKVPSRLLVSQRNMKLRPWDRSPTRPPLRPGRHGRSAPGGMGALPHGGTRALPHAAGRPLR